MTSRTQHTRGYALLFVLFVAIALGVVVGGLFALLTESVASSRQSTEEIQQLYGCDGALRLAMSVAEGNGTDIDIADQIGALGSLTAGLRSDINARSSRPFADILGITINQTSSLTLPVTRAPFHGMQFVQQSREIVVTADPLASRGRTCRAESPNRLRTISYFQFAVVSYDSISSADGFGRTLGTEDEIFTLQHASPLAPNQRDVRTIQLTEKQTFRPVPPSGQPWSFINKKKKFLGGTKRRTRHKPPVVEYFIKYPTNTPGIDPTLSRFARQADIRIIDGEWFIDDDRGNFPGERIWSDRPGNYPNGRTAVVPVQYSAYDSPTSGSARGGAAVVRYGVIDDARKSLLFNACPAPNDTANKLTPLAASNGMTECEGVETTPTPADPWLDAASHGFDDPYKTSGNDTAILPIIFDVAAFAAALNTPSDTSGVRDLGAERCLTLDDTDPTCPLTRRFRGSVWIGTLPNSFNPGDPNGTPITSSRQRVPASNQNRIPCPLVARGNTDCQRPNAVVLINAESLGAFRLTGLSIGSNLPMYVMGDVNEASPIRRVALMSPVITALSRDANLAHFSWHRDLAAADRPALTDGSNLTWVTSLLTGWSAPKRFGRFTDRRDHRRDVVRRLQTRGGWHVDLVGSMVMMFDRKNYTEVRSFETNKGNFRSPEPDPVQIGIPTFSAATGIGRIFDSGDNDAEVNFNSFSRRDSRLAEVRARFPGEPERDLRRADFTRQPPGALRFSIDPAPINRR